MDNDTLKSAVGRAKKSKVAPADAPASEEEISEVVAAAIAEVRAEVAAEEVEAAFGAVFGETVSDDPPVDESTLPPAEDGPPELTGDGTGEALPLAEDGDLPLMGWVDPFDPYNDESEGPPPEGCDCFEFPEYACGYNAALAAVLVIMDCDRDVQFADKCTAIRKLSMEEWSADEEEEDGEDGATVEPALD